MSKLKWQLANVDALLALAFVQGCDAEGYLGYWKQPPPSAADAERSSPSTSHGADAGTVPGASAVAGALAPIASIDAGSIQAGAASQPDLCARARGAGAALEVTVVDPNAVTYNFADGAAFPAGRYRIAYVDGCRRYDNTEAWTLHASVLASGLSAEGRGGCYLVMSNSQALDLAPGTSGVIVGEGPDPAGAFASYDECVAANLKIMPLDLQFNGGTLGIMNAGDSTPDKTSGEAIGRRSPTYRLTRLNDCP